MSVVAALPAPLAVLVADRQPLAGGVAGDGTGATAVAGPGPPPQPVLPTAAAVLARPGAVAALLAHPALQPDAAAARALGDGLARLAQLLGQEAVPGAVTTAPAAALVRRLAGIAIAALPAAVASDRLLAALAPVASAPATASRTAGVNEEAGARRPGAPTVLAEAVAAGGGAEAALAAGPGAAGPTRREALEETVRGEERRLLTEQPLLGWLRSAADGLGSWPAWAGQPGWRAALPPEPAPADADGRRAGCQDWPACAAGQVRLALELPRLGAVRAELALVAGRVTVELVAGPAGAAALGGRLGELRRSLAALALDAECAVRPAADG